jgi:RNA polymerase sigma factor (sigma-70 family)
MSKQTLRPDLPELLERLKKGAPEAFETLYRDVWPQVADFILQNNGSIEEAKDVFQESLLVVIRYLKRPDFSLNVQINTFIVAIVRKMWMKHLRRKKHLSGMEIKDAADSIEDDNDLETEKTIDKRSMLAKALLQQIGNECRTLLTEYYFSKTPLNVIGKMMGYTEGFVRVKKVRCLSELRKLLSGHPEFINQ